jgi:hypothetical protein
MVDRRVSVLVPFLLLPSVDLWAQGLPVDTGSHVPVALWFVGCMILGLVMAYAIVHTRGRSRSERRVTEQATEQLYNDVERDRRRSGDP